MTTWILIPILAFVVATAATAVMMRLSPRLHLTDRPDGHRKLHREAVPLGGGVAVFLGVVAAMGALTVWTPKAWEVPLTAASPFVFALLAASIVIIIVGLADDRYSLRGRHKLLGQIAAALVLIVAELWIERGGVLIQKVVVFEYPIELGPLAIPFTLFWLVGAINALNLIDGVDGLAAGVGAIVSITIGVLALQGNHYASAMISFCLAASLLGFLRYNFPPAKIFLGDAGSMLIGLVVGALAVRSSLKGAATVALAAPLAVLTIPILDSAAAILRRKLTGRSIYATDRAHLHHRLLDLFGSGRTTLIWIALFCASTSIGALISAYQQNDLLALITAAAVVAILVVTRVFGHVELLLLGSHLKSIGLSMISLKKETNGRAVQAAVRLQGSRPWELLWNTLTEFADKLGLTAIRLDVNLPADREGYHASWQRSTAHRPDGLWRTEIPLYSRNRIVGRLTIAGAPDGESMCEAVQRVMDLLQPYETRFFEMAGSISTAGTPVPETPLASTTAASAIPVVQQNKVDFE